MREQRSRCRGGERPLTTNTPWKQRDWRVPAALVSVAALAVVAVVVAVQFRGGFSSAVPVTLVSPRAGLVSPQEPGGSSDELF